MRPRTSTAYNHLPGASDLGAPRRRPDFLLILGPSNPYRIRPSTGRIRPRRSAPTSRLCTARSVRRRRRTRTAPVRAVKVACHWQATLRRDNSFAPSMLIKRVPTRSPTAWELRSGALAAGRAPLCQALSARKGAQRSEHISRRRASEIILGTCQTTRVSRPSCGCGSSGVPCG